MKERKRASGGSWNTWKFVRPMGHGTSNVWHSVSIAFIINSRIQMLSICAFLNHTQTCRSHAYRCRFARPLEHISWRGNWEWCVVRCRQTYNHIKCYTSRSYCSWEAAAAAVWQQWRQQLSILMAHLSALRTNNENQFDEQKKWFPRKKTDYGWRVTMANNKWEYSLLGSQFSISPRIHSMGRNYINTN